MDDIIKKKNYYNTLYSYYGKLITKKQQEIFEYYYFNDFSLTEISDELQISRNAVHDSLKKTIENFDKLESILKLYQKDQALEELLNHYNNEQYKELIDRIRELE